jgi:hypothetical protein
MNLLSALTLARTSLLALADSPGAGTRSVAYVALGTLWQAMQDAGRIYSVDTETTLSRICTSLKSRRVGLYVGPMTAFQARALAGAIALVEDAVEREEMGEVRNAG